MSNRKRSKTRKKRKSGRSYASAPLVLPSQRTAGRLLHAGALGLLPARRRPLVQLDDGSVGYTMDPTRRDDCFRAALATLLGVPVEQVPDPRLDERLEAGEDPEEINRETWARLDAWLAGRALRLVLHHDALPVDCDRWIGVARAPDPDDIFGDHCLVLSRDQVIFNPSISLEVPRGMQIERPTLANIAYGITCDSKEK